jgi:hypothetical protein
MLVTCDASVCLRLVSEVCGKLSTALPANVYRGDQRRLPFEDRRTSPTHPNVHAQSPTVPRGTQNGWRRKREAD